MAVSELTHGNDTAARVAFQHLKNDNAYKALAVLGLGVLDRNIESFHEAERLMNSSVKEKYKEQIKQMVNVKVKTPLMTSIIKLDTQSVQFLLSLGINASEKNAALKYVAYLTPSDSDVDSVIEITRILLNAGADASGVTYDVATGVYVPKAVKKMILEHNPAAKSKKGCYVATAVYGSYDCPEVWTLRRFRDNTLAETWYGRAFIRTYYAISPTLVKWFGETDWFKKLWKPSLDRMVRRLNGNGVADTPYDDRAW